ncbi:MAG: hypothetical protein ACTIBM_08075, partial [Lacticaseibacillus paracasei]
FLCAEEHAGVHSLPVWEKVASHTLPAGFIDTRQLNEIREIATIRVSFTLKTVTIKVIRNDQVHTQKRSDNFEEFSISE